MRLASAADFEQGGLYSNYRKYPFYAERADTLVSLFGSGKILIAGCGWGYLVEEAIARGFDAWGCDASTYATAKAQSILGVSVKPRVLQANVTVRSQLAAVKTAAGLSSAQKFKAVITEDLLPVLTDAEITTALAELRRICATGGMFHIVTPLSDVNVAPLNWKSIADWKVLTGELVMSAETGVVV